MRLRCVPVLAMAFWLGGCSISSFLPDWSSPDAAGPEPAYRFVIANSLKDILGSATPDGTLNISGVQRTDSLKGASWQVCLKFSKMPLPPRFYAVFIQSNRVVDSRISVLIDRCELQDYAAFDWIAEAKAPAR